MNGRHVVAIDSGDLARVRHARELVIPAAAHYIQDRAYEFLVPRPHQWRKQWYLKGRNMTVGQLVAIMNANEWTPEEAADEYNLPVAQVQEALAYYSAHRALVEAELKEEAKRVRSREKPR